MERKHGLWVELLALSTLLPPGFLLQERTLPLLVTVGGVLLLVAAQTAWQTD